MSSVFLLFSDDRVGCAMSTPKWFVPVRTSTQSGDAVGTRQMHASVDMVWTGDMVWTVDMVWTGLPPTNR